MENHEPQNTKIILPKKSKVGGNFLPNIKADYTASVLKTVWYWQKDRHTNQRNRTKDSETDPHKYAQLIFHKGIKPTQGREDKPFQQMSEQLDIHRQKKKKDWLKPHTLYKNY